MPLSVGDTVHVPRRLLGVDENGISPFHTTTIRERQDRSVRVDKPDGTLSDLISSKMVWSEYGILIIRIGDFNEDHLLDPLATSIYNYSKMLLSPDSVRLVELRTKIEFDTLWAQHHGMCQQLVIVGHGTKQSLIFGNDEVSAASFAEMIERPNPSKKEILSLACNTGYAGFSQTLSRSQAVSHCVAPFHKVHGCVGSLFASTFLHERLLAFHSPKTAFKPARADLIGAISFRLWENGKLTAGQN